MFKFLTDTCFLIRVKIGTITDEDKKFFLSRIIPCPSENSNESFRTGKVVIIVTTNLKKDAVNIEKLKNLLPGVQEFVCNCVDRVTNLPARNSLPDKLNLNPGKTGNLQKELKLM